MAYPPNTPLGRFGIETLEQGPERCVATVLAAPLVNPLTHTPTVATLALLVDHLGGLINHCRRGPGQWTVSSELSLEVVPDAVDVLAASAGAPVLGVSRPLGRRDNDALGLCELSSEGHALATATVRSFYIAAPDTVAQDWPSDSAGVPAGPTLRELMTLDVGETGGAATVLLQGEDPALNNLVGVVHGGISSMGLELAASAEVNRDAEGEPYRTASLRVNFLRPFHSGAQARYVADRLHRGRSTGVAEARAVGSDGRVAMLGRLTAYR
ncbi:PaaI family thioesterase [Mycolicibacterium sp. S3B2]|uniref:PaaI family thioesterase n=1 Tax=Mycolicibacterium sp. S3B2 TaxID=3415120 RepID=UPI003C79EB19